MVAFSSLSCWPRRLDPDQALLISSISLSRYEKSLGCFVSWLIRNNHNPVTADHLDCLVVSFKNDLSLSKSNLNYTVASLEFFLPTCKGKLVWARRVAAGKMAAAPTKHTVPMVSKVCYFYGAKFAASGRYRMGVYIVLQQATGLRPSEGLKLLASHVSKPEFANGRFVFRLGANVGTKVKREQVAYLDPLEHPQLAGLLSELLRHTKPHEKLFPVSYCAYNTAIHGVSDCMHVNVRFTAHSPRAGFASENIAMGKRPDDVRLAGRWGSDQNFKIYIDIVSAAQISALVSLAGLREAMVFTYINFPAYFPSGCFAAADAHGPEAMPSRLGEKSDETRRIRAASHGLSRGRPAAQAQRDAKGGSGKGRQGSVKRSSSSGFGKGGGSRAQQPHGRGRGTA